MTNLETEVKSLETEVKSLKDIRSKNLVRTLIEKGRKILWKEHENEYMNNEDVVNNKKKYIEEKKYYDKTTKKITAFRKPIYWSHFIDFIPSLNQESEVIPFLSLLEGGQFCVFSEYSIEVHEGSEKEIADVIKYLNLNGTENEALFSFVFGKLSVDEV